MKTKSILFAVAALILLSFTFVSKQTKETSKAEAKQTTQISTQAKGGLAMEDKW
ncbi:MAG TPA: hypothetical protein VFW11_23760 [Cyclobacteriaceae bacterium]|jgi:hypothetical protein|nr:hypothetical protein [Cyclobacteriaceae bacterium]